MDRKSTAILRNRNIHFNKNGLKVSKEHYMEWKYGVSISKKGGGSVLNIALSDKSIFSHSSSP